MYMSMSHLGGSGSHGIKERFNLPPLVLKAGHLSDCYLHGISRMMPEQALGGITLGLRLVTKINHQNFHVCLLELFSEESSQSPDHEPAEVGDITMKSRHRVRSASPNRLRATLKATQRLIMSRSARIRMRASVVVPGVSEGVLPPDAEPVTAQEALHHLAKMVRVGGEV